MKPNLRKQVVLDTETTGMQFQGACQAGHRIIEIGAIELIDRKPGASFQTYLNPGRTVTPEATAVCGITDEQLRDQPTFDTIVDEFLAFIEDAELIIHNAPFDLAFLNQELMLSQKLALPEDGEVSPILQTKHPVVDTLKLAREKFPRKKNNLDALCKRLGVSNEHRHFHGALLDAQLLLNVYLALTGGQTCFTLLDKDSADTALNPSLVSSSLAAPNLIVQVPTEEELRAHLNVLEDMYNTGTHPLPWH